MAPVTSTVVVLVFAIVMGILNGIDGQISILMTAIPQLISILENVNDTSTKMASILPEMASSLKHQEALQSETNFLLENATSITDTYFLEDQQDMENPVVPLPLVEKDNRTEITDRLDRLENILVQMGNVQIQIANTQARMAESLDQIQVANTQTRMAESLDQIQMANTQARMAESLDQIQMANTQARMAESLDQMVQVLQDMNECYSRPCQNQGKCANGDNGYTCECQPGWTGANCQIDFDECNSNPCQYGGECTDGVNGYKCQCTVAWTGPNCEINFDECNSNPCQHGGECTDEINGYTCQCSAAWTGPNCEINFDECNSNPCQHGGECTDEINGYTCQCSAAWTGPNCERNNCWRPWDPYGAWMPFVDYCYLFINNAVTFDQAQSFCQRYGANLASIHSQEEQDFIKTKISDDYDTWIGLTDEAEENNFIWNDGTHVNYTNWNIHEPNNSGGEDCVHLQRDGKWNDYVCEETYSTICKRVP